MKSPIYVLEEATYTSEYGKPVIILYSRPLNNKSELVIHKVRGFRPYFYIPADEVDNATDYRITKVSDDVELDALGRNVRKCFTRMPTDVREVREDFTFTDMSDFLFEKRFLIDQKLTYAYIWDGSRPRPVIIDSILQPRIVFFDIEVLAPEGTFPEVDKTNYPVIMIQLLDTYTGKKVILTNGIPKVADDQVACENEHELFNTFMEYLKRVDPDLLTGWNCSRYDFPYLIRRAEKIHANVKGLARQGTPRCGFDLVTKEYRCHIRGRSTMDMLEAYKKYMVMKSQKESYDLKTISASYNFEYTDYGPKLQQLMDKKDYLTLIEYGRNDVIALQNIENNTGIISFYENLRMIAGTRLDDTLHNSTLIEMLLLHHGIKPMPRKMQLYGKKEKFKGATVVLPPKGIHKWVATVDLASLYPTIMQAFPDETCPDIDLKVIEVLKIMFDKRNELRQQRLNGDNSPTIELQEQGYKVIANSFYGVCGAPTFRLYKRECAEYVTKVGREVNLFMRECIMKKQKSILYSDSVAGNSKVKIYNKNKKSEVIEIKNLFTKVDTICDKTGKEYCILNDAFVESIDNEGKVILDPIKCIMRHKCKKQMFRVYITDSHHVDVTEDHSLAVYDNKKISSCPTKDLASKHKSVILKHNLAKTDNSSDWTYSDDVRVEKIDYDDYVYDLTTTYTHKFFVNGILALNTDSAFFSEIESIDEGLEMQNYLNDELKKWGKEKGAKIDFTLKFEKYFRKLLFKEKKSGEPAKKKYAGHLLWEEGTTENKLCYKGIEVTRSDNPIVLKTLLKDFLELLLMHDNPDGAIKMIQQVCKDVRSGNINIYDVSIPKAVRKAASGDNPWKRGIENTKHELKYIIPAECKPRLIYLKRSPHEMCIDDEINTEQFEDKIDWDKTFRKVLEDKLKTYVESAGFYWDHFIHNQQTLDKWFK